MITEFFEDTPWLTLAIIALLVPVATAATLSSRRLLREQNLSVKGLTCSFWGFLRANPYAHLVIAVTVGATFLVSFKEFPDWYYMPAWAYPVAMMPLLAVILRWLPTPTRWRTIGIIAASAVIVLTASIASTKEAETDRRTYGHKLGVVSEYDWFKYMFTAAEAEKEFWADPLRHDLGNAGYFIGLDAGFEGLAVRGYLQWEAGRDLTREEIRAAGNEFGGQFVVDESQVWHPALLFKLIRIGFLSGVNPDEARRSFDFYWEHLPSAKRQEAYQALERHFQHKREPQKTAQGIIDDLTARKYFNELQALQPGQDLERQAFLFAELNRYIQARDGLESK